TFLHLLPETFEEIGGEAGIYLLVGFFLQLMIQRVTHGIEHGHVHVEPHEHRIPLVPIVLGLSLHAFMEGLPLGFNYRMEATQPSLYLAVAAHKLPEAMLLAMLVRSTRGKAAAYITLLLFSMVTPAASILATYLGQTYYALSQVVPSLVPLVAGAHILLHTTIYI